MKSMVIAALMIVSIDNAIAFPSTCADYLKIVAQSQKTPAEIKKFWLRDRLKEFYELASRIDANRKKPKIILGAWIVVGKDLFWVKESLKPLLEMEKLFFEHRLGVDSTENIAIAKKTVEKIDEILEFLKTSSQPYSLENFVADIDPVRGIDDTRQAIDLLFLNGRASFLEANSLERIHQEIDAALKKSNESPQCKALEESLYMFHRNRGEAPHQVDF